MAILGVLLAGIFFFTLPIHLFQDPVSTVLLSESGELMGARIAEDGQWRFPQMDSVPGNFQVAITQFEDKRFFYHPGVDVLAIGRALIQNLKKGEVVSGGSTLSMQVIRLARKGKARTIWEKIIEGVLATKLELQYSKQEILALYASHAPFGGNVVGLEAAAWKYYGRQSHQLSWAEASTLAVLPNAPGLIHPGRNRDALKRKRDRLLDKMIENGKLDSLSGILAKDEPLPQKPLALPDKAPHLLAHIYERQKSQKLQISAVRSSLDRVLQQHASSVIQRFYLNLKNNGVHNAAALIADVHSGKVLAYVGNTQAEENAELHGHAVDIIRAPRSTGSILKPLLYAAMLSDGEILPRTLVPDIPSYFRGYAPVNYTHEYAGAIPAGKALARSLNVPSVRMLRDYGIPRFQDRLKELGMNTLHRPPNEYGLTLILGGAEATLWDLCGIYASMARSLGNYYQYEGKYAPDMFQPLGYQAPFITEAFPSQALHPQGVISAASIWHTFEAMQEVVRPENERYWQHFSSSRRLAWKTGTSFGNRDAWAIGCSPDYVVGVWVGNADGEGRPGLTGIGAAAPILFDLVNLLPPSTGWFEAPFQEMYQAETCSQSGYLAGPHCPTAHEWVPKVGENTQTCPFHKLIWLDSSLSFQVNDLCTLPSQRKSAAWFVLPPIQAHYYKQRNPTYQDLPAYRADCLNPSATSRPVMQLIYPQHQAKIYVPIELDGQPGRTVFELAHQETQTKVHWHLDQVYIGTTEGVHEMAMNPSPGMHTLTWVDQKGATLEQAFEILVKE